METFCASDFASPFTREVAKSYDARVGAVSYTHLSNYTINFFTLHLRSVEDTKGIPLPRNTTAIIDKTKKSKSA